jgi:hypothetical protein
MTDQPRRTVRLDSGYDTSDYAWFQSNYLHPVARRFYPNTLVYVGDELIFQTNSYGCKGAEPEPGLKLLGVFGDSVVQGVNMASFVDHMQIPGFAALNGGIEGSTLRPTIDRLLEFQGRFPMACAAVHTGWHNLIYDERGEDFWASQLDRIVGPETIAHFTLVADINPTVIDAGYTHLFREGVYWRWMDELFVDKARLQDFYDQMNAFNRFIRAYCEDRGRILIDLTATLAPRGFTDVSRKFIDLIHPRASVYREIGAEVASQLGRHIAHTPGPAAEPAPHTPATAAPGGAPQTGRNYPLW